MIPKSCLRESERLGVGVGLRIPHYSHILAQKPVVDWFEVISEGYMVDGGRPLEVLDRILEQYRVVLHGVALYPGSPGRPDSSYLKRLRDLVRRTNTPWISDHLCWGSVDGTYSHDLLPLPYTMDCVQHVARNLRETADTVERPIVVENLSSYVEFKDSVMTEWEFLSEVVESADCGILLDVNNIYVSSVNHGFDPIEYLENIPHERVVQIHIAGHSRMERFIIDTHDRPVADPVWKIYQKAMALCGPKATLLEWDARLPGFEEVASEAGKATAFYNDYAAKRELPLAQTGLARGARQEMSEESFSDSDEGAGLDGESWDVAVASPSSQANL